MTLQRPLGSASRRLFVVGTALTLTAGALAASSGTAAGAATATPSRGVLTAAETTVPSELQRPAASNHRPREMPLLLRRGGLSRTSQRPPTAASSPVAGAQLRRGFPGLDATQSQAVNGFDLEPPDEGLGAGNGFVANFVNLVGAIYNTHGARLTGPFSLNAFFAEPPSANLSDPRIFYDVGTGRWFATVLEYSFNNDDEFTGSRVDIAVSTSGDPRRAFRIYRLNTNNNSHAGCPCLADYPILGIDAYNIYLSNQEFQRNFATFNGSQIYAISKSQLVAGAPARYVLFPNVSIGGTLAYHVQPATTYGTPGAEYMMAALDPNATFDNRLGVFALTRPQDVSSGGSPRLTSKVISSETYGQPPNAVTPPGYDSGVGEPTTGVVATDFDAMQEVQYIEGHLVGALNTAITIPGDTSERAGVAWFDVKPSVSRDAIGPTYVRQQGYVAANGLYLLYPHINRTPNGAMAMTFGVGGPSTFLSAAYATMPPGGTRFGAIRIAGGGVAPDNGFTATEPYGGVGRWGDYSAGEIIFGNNRVWLATQYIPNQGDQFANWGNYIFQLQL